MVPGPENYSSSSSQPEKSESQPQPKHKIYIEKQPSKETEQRKQWLKEMLPMRNGDTRYMNGDVRREYAHALDTWYYDIPAHAKTIAALRRYDERSEVRVGPNPRFIPRAMYEAHDKGDQDALGQYQQFGRALVNRYSGRAENKQWSDLPEEHKGFVRFGEMTVLMVDTLKALRALREQKTTPGKASKLSNIVVRYSESADIPADFESIFANSLYKRVHGLEEAPPAQPDLNLAPWEAGTLRSALGGRSPEEENTFLDLWRPWYNKSSPYDKLPKTTIETTYVENPGKAHQGKKVDNIVETEFNPATGMYESVGEEYTTPDTTPGKPQGLTYKPKASSSNKGNSPSVGPEAPPSAPSTSPAPASPSAPPA